VTTPVLATLIDAAALRALQAGPTPARLVDCGFDLVDPTLGERDFAAGHLPGAAYAHLDRDLSGTKTGRNGRHPLPERAAFAATLGRLGIAADTPVVTYDRQGGPYAARLWWMLRWMGHGPVAVLDGGTKAWTAAGGALLPSTADSAAPAALPPYPERPARATRIDTATLAARLGRSPLIDARSAARFRGETEPFDPIAGHIPGALNRFHGDNLQADGRFRPAAELRAAFAPLLGLASPADAVHSCGSGVTACHNLLAMEHAGLTGSALYGGSWSEWVSDPSRPVARG
jgi:thiosulfate/3-mercaptopyruvate sulfurtransferase